MNEETAELLRQIKAYRNDMVARNYPFQDFLASLLFKVPQPIVS